MKDCSNSKESASPKNFRESCCVQLVSCAELGCALGVISVAVDVTVGPNFLAFILRTTSSM